MIRLLGMVPMPSADKTALLSEETRNLLLQIASNAIQHGLFHGTPLQVDADDYQDVLQAHRASFVTLQQHGELRGCIGHLEAFQPLVVDVAENAYAAAFQDPRFPPVSDKEMEEIEIHISVLTPASPMVFNSEAELIAQLRPGQDGLILQDGYKKGTFLPSVWESLPDPEAFIRHLKLKAGLPASYWSNTLKIFRYETESFP